MTKDPLAGLSAFEKRRILLMPTTWSERWRLCDPKLSPVQTRALVITILSERRALYDQWFDHRLRFATLQRAERRYRDGEVHLTDFGRSTALVSLAHVNRERQHPTRQALRYRAAYEQQRQAAELGRDR